MYCKKLFIALSYICAVLTASQIFADTYIVDPTGTYKTIQSAYTAAGSGDTILLTAGYTYTGSGNINLTFAKDLTLGRTGDGTDPIIDMEESGRFCRIDSSSTVTISNLVVQNGRATTGGAIYNNASFLYMFSCTFIDNTAVNPSRGGAVWSNGTSHATNCTFNNSYSSDYGGAICNDNGNFLTTDCTFNHNHAGTGGGAIANYQSNSNFQVAGCIFNDNDASGGGAVMTYGTFQATDCTFSNNKATGNITGGGAINTPSGSSSISCCRFVGNTAKLTASTIQKLTGGVVTAQNCWWGTNYPNRKTLFNNTLAVSAYSPYITINLLPDPLFIPVGTPTLITADFTQNSTGESHGCTIMNGTPVIFSTDSLDTTVSPTLAYIVSGQAQTTLYDISETNTFSLCAKTDTDLSTTGYTYCETATPTIDPTEVYVSAIDGDDANLGDSPDNPVKTIQRGLDRLSQVSTNTLYLYLEQGNTFTGTGNNYFHSVTFF